MDCSTPDFLSSITSTWVCWITCPLSWWYHPNISSSSPSPPAFNLSQHLGLFQLVSYSHQVAKVLSFSFSWSTLKEYLGLISFRNDWFDLLAIQGTLKSLLQHHSLKASIIQRHSAFCMVQLSHPYMTTGKTIALTRQTFVSKLMSLLFNMLSRFVIAFLPRSKYLLISWLQSPSAVISEHKKIKSLFPLFPHLYDMTWWGQMPWSWFSECWALSQLFHSPLLLSSRGCLVPLHFLP